MNTPWLGHSIALEEKMITAIKAYEQAKDAPNIEPMIDRKFVIEKAEQSKIE
jgi:hypothetical protein